MKYYLHDHDHSDLEENHDHHAFDHHLGEFCGHNDSFPGAEDHFEEWVYGGKTAFAVFAWVNGLQIPFIVIGNVLIISAVIVFKGLRNQTSLMLVSLAVSDLFVGLVTVPVWVASYLDPLTWRCRRLPCLLMSGIDLISRTSTLLNLTVIVLDRYFSIHHPFSYSRRRTMRNVRLVISCVWLYVVVVSAIPLLGVNRWEEVKHRLCSTISIAVPAYKVFTLYLTPGLMILAIGVLYAKIFLTAAKHRRAISGQRAAVSSLTRRRSGSSSLLVELKTCRMMAVVYALFLLCGLPLYLSILAYTINGTPVTKLVAHIGVALCNFHSAVNAFVYVRMNSQLRYAFGLLLSTPLWSWGSIRYEVALLQFHTSTGSRVSTRLSLSASRSGLSLHSDSQVKTGRSLTDFERGILTGNKQELGVIWTSMKTSTSRVSFLDDSGEQKSNVQLACEVENGNGRNNGQGHDEGKGHDNGKVQNNGKGHDEGKGHVNNKGHDKDEGH